MAKRVQFIRHSTGSADAFTGLIGEITVDTTRKEVRVHDGLTAGGHPQARRDLDNVSAATSGTAGKMTAAQVVELTNATANIAAESITRAAADVTLQNNIDTLTATKVAKAGDTMTGLLIVDRDGAGLVLKSQSDAGWNNLVCRDSLSNPLGSFAYDHTGDAVFMYHHNTDKHLGISAGGIPYSNGVQGSGSTALVMYPKLTSDIAAAVLAVKQAIFPVGSLYISTLTTNPNTLLGFGTWSLYQQDRMLMSAGSSYALGSTGGTKDSVVVSHTHGFSGTTGNNSATHNHTFNVGQLVTPITMPAGGGGTPTGSMTTNNQSADHIHGFSGTTGAASGGVSGTNQNLPPYIAVNIWQRTA